MTTPIILVPGFWLGAWAWDEVASRLEAYGHRVRALTLPGLDHSDTDRSRITFTDHVDAICDAIRQEGEPVVLVVHSAAGFSGYAASDRLPEAIAAVVYVDTAPGRGAPEPDFEGDEFPIPWDDLIEEENLDGLTEHQLDAFRRRAVPQPGGVLRGSADLTNDARRHLASTIVCTGFPSDQVKEAVAEGYAWLAGVPELTNLTWVDLPTSHWPMWSRPADLAVLIGDVAVRSSSRLGPG